MAIIDLPIEADCRIGTNSGVLDTNYESSFGNFWHTNGSYEWRTVLRPNLSTLPAAAVISSVVLYLFVEGGTDNQNVDNLYRLRRQFVETEVTGRRARSGVNWTTYGAENTESDRYPTSAGTITVPNSTQQWRTMSISVSEFNALVLNNYGFLLKQVSGNLERYYRSRSYSGYAPYFRVTYTLPTKRRGVIWFM